MTDEIQKTLTDTWISRLKNNRIVASLVIVTAIVSGIGTFTDAWKKVNSALFSNPVPPPLTPTLTPTLTPAPTSTPVSPPKDSLDKRLPPEVCITKMRNTLGTDENIIAALDRPGGLAVQLVTAAGDGNSTCVNAFLELGAPPDGDPKDNKEPWNTPPLFMGVQAANSAVVRLLLEKGANPNLRGLKGKKPEETGTPPIVRVAMKAGDLGRAKEVQEIVKLLLAARADPNAANDEGYTALHYAAAHGDLDLVKVLIEHGAKKDIKTRDGNMTPLDMARQNNKFNVVGL